jgi:phospholipase/carboxylesterase
MNARIVATGASLDKAAGAMIMLHGRGATAENILGLSAEFDRNDIAYLAPQAENYSWYPNRFIAPRQSNEPHLGAALKVISQLLEEVMHHGHATKQIFLLGFSQGACLALDYAASAGLPLAGVFALSGGLIGDTVSAADYKSIPEDTPVFLGCDKADFHIPLARVNESAIIMQQLGANVEKRIYDDLGHSINQDEIDQIRFILQERLSVLTATSK